MTCHLPLLNLNHTTTDRLVSFRTQSRERQVEQGKQIIHSASEQVLS